jgi:hypothetical protein
MNRSRSWKEQANGDGIDLGGKQGAGPPTAGPREARIHVRFGFPVAERIEVAQELKVSPNGPIE